MTKMSQGNKKSTTRKIPAMNNKVLVHTGQFALFQEIPTTNYKILVHTGTSTQDSSIKIKVLKCFTCCICINCLNVFCKSKFVVNGNSQKFYFIIAFYMFIFYMLLLLFIDDPMNIIWNLLCRLATVPIIWNQFGMCVIR